MRDLMQFLPVLVFVVVIVSVVRNAAKVVRKVAEQQASAARAPADYDPELAERTRRIQEEIRRKIAERRGQTVAPEAAPVGPRMEPPVIFAEEREDPRSRRRRTPCWSASSSWPTRCARWNRPGRPSSAAPRR